MDRKNTQNNKVLQHMRDFGGITSLEAIQKYGCTRLSARIADLKRMGHTIDSKTITVDTRDGGTTRVKRYFLA